MAVASLRGARRRGGRPRGEIALLLLLLGHARAVADLTSDSADGTDDGGDGDLGGDADSGDGDVGGDMDVGSSDDPPCPTIAPMPSAYSINQLFWGFTERFSLSTSDEEKNEELGRLSRSASFFGSTFEMTLYTPNGERWASMERDGDKYVVLDCHKGKVATLTVLPSDRGFGSLSEFSIVRHDGEVVGAATSSGASVFSSEPYTFDVEDIDGNVYARLTQRKPLWMTETDVDVIDPVGKAPVNVPETADVRTDPRVLALLAASRFGAPSSLVTAAGPFLDLLAILGAICLCGLGIGYSARTCLSPGKGGAGGAGGSTSLEMRGLIRDQAFLEDGYDSGTEKKTCFGCCSSEKARQYSLPSTARAMR